MATRENSPSGRLCQIVPVKRPSTLESSPRGGPVDGWPTSQAESLAAPLLSERPHVAVRRANGFFREQPESNFQVGERSRDYLMLARIEMPSAATHRGNAPCAGVNGVWYLLYYALRCL
jgi:hypothetical protein